MNCERCRLAALGAMEREQRSVTAMFEIIAPRYDRFTRAFSFGMDAAWKRTLLDWALEDLPTNARVLDLACGTGDLALELARARPDAVIRGIDAASRMVALARERAAAQGCAAGFGVGDMMALAEPDRSVELITVGYGLRNVPDHRAALHEIARVLAPGGRCAVLDFTRPSWAPWRWAYLAYLRLAGDCFGWLWHRNRAVYGYISRSIRAFVDIAGLTGAVGAAGLRLERLDSRLGGGICLLLARKPC